MTHITFVAKQMGGKNIVSTEGVNGIMLDQSFLKAPGGPKRANMGGCSDRYHDE